MQAVGDGEVKGAVAEIVVQRVEQGVSPQDQAVFTQVVRGAVSIAIAARGKLQREGLVERRVVEPGILAQFGAAAVVAIGDTR